MNVQQKAKLIGDVLDELYPRVNPTLDFVNPYTLMVATLLSAQCTDRKVNAVTPHLFKLASTPEQMLKLGVSQIENIIRSLGLAPTKSRHIVELSEHLLSRFDGQVPRDFVALESLPGIGHKTASVVMALAFAVPAFPVDTHIRRLSQRWKLCESNDVKKIEVTLKALYPPQEWYRRHLQLIYFGREYCPARSHEVSLCPICKLI